MINKRYTDEEIMEALANCAFSAHNPDACKECHYNNVGAPICVASCTNDALDFMNRQKSEIEKLNIQLRELWNMASLYKAQGEKWEGYNENLLTANTALSNEILSAKAEAYKTFAEKLKEEFLNLQYNAKTDRKTVKIEELKEQMDWLLHKVAIETVENLLKEMTGEEE